MNPAESDFAEMLWKLMALPRYGTTDEIAALVAYLGGPEAGFVTGASLTIDAASRRNRGHAAVAKPFTSPWAPVWLRAFARDVRRLRANCVPS